MDSAGFGCTKQPIRCDAESKRGGFLGGGARPYVFINDLEFSPQPSGVIKYYTPDYWIQCHELGHYLLRRGWNQPNDPEAEHWLPGTNLLMRGGAVMPHKHNLKPEEVDKIRLRVSQNLWNSSQLTSLDP